MTPFAADITARHRADVATETADLDAEIARLEDDVRTATLTLRAAMNRRTAILQRHDAALFAALYVKVDADGCPVPRPGPPVGTVRRKGGAVEPPASTATTETPDSPTGDPEADAALATAADVFVASISGDRTPEQVRIVLADLDWAVDEMSQYSDHELACAARRRLGPQSVTLTGGRMFVDATGEAIS